MNNIIRRYVRPIGILLLGNFLITLLLKFVPSFIDKNMYNLLLVVLLFAFGFSLNNMQQRLNSFNWRHIIIILILVFMYLYDNNILHLGIFDYLKEYLIVDQVLIKILYVYLGWLFNEK